MVCFLPPEDHPASILPFSKVFYVNTSRWLHESGRSLCSQRDGEMEKQAELWLAEYYSGTEWATEGNG